MRRLIMLSVALVFGFNADARAACDPRQLDAELIAAIDKIGSGLTEEGLLNILNGLTRAEGLIKAGKLDEGCAAAENLKEQILKMAAPTGR